MNPDVIPKKDFDDDIYGFLGRMFKGKIPKSSRKSKKKKGKGKKK